MRYLARFLLLVLCLFLFVNGWYIPAGFVFAGYLFFYTGYELVVAAMLLDGYYGAFSDIPLLTIGVFVAWSGMLLLRERLLLYTQGDEILS